MESLKSFPTVTCPRSIGRPFFFRKFSEMDVTYLKRALEPVGRLAGSVLAYLIVEQGSFAVYFTARRISSTQRICRDKHLIVQVGDHCKSQKEVFVIGVSGRYN